MNLETTTKKDKAEDLTSDLPVCPCSKKHTFCDNSKKRGEGHCRECKDFKTLKKCKEAGFTPSGAAECNRICIAKLGDKKRKYTPFQEAQGRCKAASKKDYQEMLAEPYGFTLADCRFRCEIMGEKCNAFYWGPNLQLGSDPK